MTTRSRRRQAPRRRRPTVPPPPPRTAASVALHILPVLVAAALIAVDVAARIGPGRWLLSAAGAWLVVWGPTWWTRRRIVRDIYIRTYKICRDEDLAAERRSRRERLWFWQVAGRWRRNLRVGPLALNASFHGVGMGKGRVNQQRLIRIRFAPNAPWRPRRQHVIRVERRWQKQWEPGHMENLKRLQAQVSAALGGRDLAMEVSTARCRAVFTPAATTSTDQDATVVDLPSRFDYSEAM